MSKRIVQIPGHRNGFCLSIIAALIILAFSSCEADTSLSKLSTPQSSGTKTTALTIEDVDMYSSRFPQGTSYDIVGNQLTWTLPNGYTAISFDETNARVMSSSGTLTCTCVAGSGGCSPAVNNYGEYFCIQPVDCQTCNSVMETSSGSGKLTGLTITQPGHFEFIDEFLDLQDLRVAPAMILQLDTFANALAAFTANAAKDATSSTTKTVLLDAWGLVVLVEVPADVASDALTAPTEPSCVCNSGDDGCELKKGSNVTYCRANECMSCSLTVTAESSSGASQDLIFSPSGYLEE